MYHTTIKDLFNSRDIFKDLDRVSDSEARSICVIPFGSVDDVFKIITEKVFNSKTVKEIKKKKGIGLYTLEVYSRSEGVQTASGNFLIYKVPGYEYSFLLISLDDTVFFHRQLRSFIRQFKTEIILPFIKSHDLIKLIETYQSSNGIDEIIIARASQKIRYDGEHRMTSVTWNNSNVEKAYEWLREHNGFFKSIQFKAMSLGFEVTNTFVDRRGTMRIQRNFSKVFAAIVKPNVDVLNRYIILFNKRGRRDNKHLDVRPLEINFDSELFQDKANHAKFIEMMCLLKDASISTLHGNPYIHVSIMDYIDGSSYDLWVVDTKQILLVPQLRSTIMSLKRIVNHIFDYYAEGEIVSYGKQG